jgi:hypothetical protein
VLCGLCCLFFVFHCSICNLFSFFVILSLCVHIASLFGLICWDVVLFVGLFVLSICFVLQCLFLLFLFALHILITFPQASLSQLPSFSGFALVVLFPIPTLHPPRETVQHTKSGKSKGSGKWRSFKVRVVSVCSDCIADS